jgi:hypothetical protein
MQVAIIQVICKALSARKVKKVLFSFILHYYQSKEAGLESS